MCGIAGGWLQDCSDPIDQRLREALAAMRQRGPDDHGYETHQLKKGFLALGHTRLSIIDLSPGGHQPMYSHDQRHGLVFNGEIYNYRELRKEIAESGYVFRTDSDTEVLLAAWQRWGSAALTRLVGMFAFALFDQVAGTLTCVRDAFGIKPFFYTQESGNFFFASEVQALRALKNQRPELNWQRAYDYLVHGDYDSGPDSFFKDVMHLLPGHLLTVDLATGQVGDPEPWWRPCIRERSDMSFREATDSLRDLFLGNIRLHLRSDVPLGAALSGGIDSSAVVCAMRHVEPDARINTFSYIARDSAVSEEIWVDRINAHVGAVPHKVVVDPEELARDLESMIATQGEPFGSTSIYAQFRVFQLAKENGVTVTLDGQGADELLAGYLGYPGQRLRSLLEGGRYREAWHFLNNWAQWPGRSRSGGLKRLAGELTDGALYRFLRNLSGRQDVPRWINGGVLEEAGVAPEFPRVPPVGNETGRRVMAELGIALTRRGLPSLLRHGDRNSMRFSVESRVPFLTLEMANFLLSLPEEYLISPQGETKHLFRAAMRGIVPDEVLDRRDKIGFATPERDWMISLAPRVREWLKVDLRLPFLDQSLVLKEFDLIVEGKKGFSWQVWRWVNFFRWHSHCFL